MGVMYLMNVSDERPYPGGTSQVELARQRKPVPAETLQPLLVRATWNVEVLEGGKHAEKFT